MRAPDLGHWRKSSRSGNGGGACVEVGESPRIRGVRDSKLGAASQVLVFGHDTWAAFLTGLKSGRFDQNW